MTDPTVLSVEGYTLDLATDAGLLHVLQDIDLSVGRGEVLGLVGESGSGKTTLAYAIMRHLPPVARERSGVIRLGGDDLTVMPERKVERLRGRRIGMVFQDPGTSLNPTMRLGDQVAEVLIRHRGLDRTTAWRQGEAMLERVGLKTPGAMMHRYPHEVSGGEKQRVVIAAAFACRPECILFDEPTTALDVITAQQILELFRDLQAETGVASLYISHDLALVSKFAQRVAVIHRGRIVEEDPADRIFSAPRRDYTRRLIASVPRPDHRLVDNGPPTPEHDLIRVDGMTVRYGTPPLLGRLMGRSETVIGARSVSFGLASGEILGVVGESGSGKSTIAKALVGLNPFEGNIAYGGRQISGHAAMDKSYRRDIQVVFQNPDSSLNPRQRIGDILARPLRLYGVDGAGGVKAQIPRLLEDVQLPAEFAQRYPHQLSGGEKQRVAIARAFASRPRLVICDEITSALDVSIQAAVVKLLLSLRDRYGTAYLFITHDLNLVRQIAHRVLVMYRGDLVETASSTELTRGPAHAYTRALLDAVPTPVG